MEGDVMQGDGREVMEGDGRRGDGGRWKER